MTTQLCVPFNEIGREGVILAGGKGANLGDMAQAGLPVPPGFIISSKAFRQVTQESGIWKKVCNYLQDINRDDHESLQENSTRIRRLFKDIAIKEPLLGHILKSYSAFGDNVPVAVRSSATAEDTADASFAGQQETMLNVVSTDGLIEALRRCWSSMFTSQALYYRKQFGFVDEEVSMAVVVQKMVRSEKSGVSFTVDPVMRNRRHMVIEAVWGLGEGIVSGTITPDHYKMDRRTYEILFEFVPEKKLMFRENDDGGIMSVPVPSDKVSKRILSDDELRQLVDLGKRLEDHFGCPQDVEWAIEDGNIYLLQSRPITSL